MKISVCMAMMLLISMLAISPAFGSTPVESIDLKTCRAPNAGDGISDGSGWDQDEFGAPNSGDGIPDGSGWDHEDFGAPNSGDGIPDGSGWDRDDPGATEIYSWFVVNVFI